MIIVDADIIHNIVRNVNNIEVDFITYIKHIRRVEKNTDAILFTSHKSYETILTETKSALLSSIGHYYLSKEEYHHYLQNGRFDEEAYLEDKPHIKYLNAIQWRDIVFNFCRNKSFLSSGFHDLKGKLTAIYKDNSISNKQELFDKLLEDFKNSIKLESDAYPGLYDKVEEFLNKYNPDDINSITNITSVQESVFTALIPEDDDENANSITKKYHWKVLILDDEPTGLADLTKKFDEKALTYNIVNSVAEAKKIIEDDLLNEYTIVIADYRLYEKELLPNGKYKMQNEQGYDFLIWIASKQKFIGLIALSGLSNTFLMDSFRQYQINVKVYSKNVLNVEGANIIVDDILHTGNKMYEAILSVPKQTKWKTEMQPYYHWLKTECTEIDKIEAEISQEAEKIISEIEAQIEFIKIEKIVHDAYLGFALSDCKKRATESLGNDFTLEKLDLVKIKLTYRRVLIYFSIMETIPLNILCKILNLGNASALVTKSNGEMSDEQDYKGMKKQIFSLQYLQENDIPFNILVEEKYWLYRKMGIDVFDAQIKINPMQELIIFSISAIAEKYPSLKTHLKHIQKNFSSGKSIGDINKDMQDLLKELNRKDTNVCKTFANELYKCLLAIQASLGTIRYAESLETTIKKYIQ